MTLCVTRNLKHLNRKITKADPVSFTERFIQTWDLLPFLGFTINCAGRCRFEG